MQRNNWVRKLEFWVNKDIM